ncbi:MAG: aminotransferase class IV [Chloroflexota bacterium]
MEEVVYLNGSLLPRSRAVVSVFDHGFLYGYGLFETMRAYKGRIFQLERHLERLLASSRVLGLEAGLGGIDLGRAVRETLKANNLEDARLRLTVSRGEVDSFPGPHTTPVPTVLVTSRSYTPLPPEVYDRGFRAGVSSYRRYSQSPLVGLKSASYLLNVLAKMEAGAAGLDEALLLNERGFIAEGSTSNIFFVAAGSGLVTPPVASGLLAGITRRVVMELAGALGIAVTESEVGLADLGQFSQAFLTNSVMEIMPLVAVQVSENKTIHIGTGNPGELTRKLMAAYRETVEREVS